jgi:hypothetical protein
MSTFEGPIVDSGHSTPLLIDADRILPGPVALQSLKAITRKTREVDKRPRGIEYFQPFPALPIKTLERPHELAICEEFRTFVPEAQDHGISTYSSGRCTSNVKGPAPPANSVPPPHFEPSDSPLVTVR